ncbi:MAG: hypothetical protein PVS3B3_31940 [Ktedonobacteraceae bacterium]
MEPQAPDWHEADLAGLLWSGEVVDAHPGGEVVALLPKGLGNGLGVVLGLVGIQAGTEEVDSVDHQ